MKLLLTSFVLACLLLMTSQLTATVHEDERRISVVTEHWLDYSNYDGTGYYFDVLYAVFPSPQWQIEIKFVPYARTRYMIDNKQADMALGFYKEENEPLDVLFSEQILEVDRVDVALRAGLEWHDIESLKDKKVEAMLAYRFDKFISFPMHYQESGDLLHMLNRLNMGYIDAVLDYQDNFLFYKDQLDNEQEFTVVESVLKNKIYFVFANNSKGKALRRHFDIEILKLITSGKLDELYRKNVNKDELRLVPIQD